MPKGITQEQVNVAADALVTAGEKPTVERVRQQLGTGSPNTVTRMLEAWRGTLAQRLQAVLTLPDVPAEVGEAAVTLWRAALTHAGAHAQAEWTQAHAELATARTTLAEEHATWETRLQAAETAAAQARTRQALAEHACANLDSQLRDSHALRDDLVHQRDRLQAVCDRQTGELEALQGERNARLTAADQERERTAAHIRAVEDRAHQEVDRARQEAKQAHERLEAAERSHRSASNALEARCETLHQQVQAAEKDVARLSGQVLALEVSLAKAHAGPKTKRAPRSSGLSKVAKAKQPK